MLCVQDIKFITADGQAVYNALFRTFKAPASEMFLPMRTAFVYDLEEHDSSTDVPTTLRRSKEDCPPVCLTPRSGWDYTRQAFSLLHATIAGFTVDAP